MALDVHLKRMGNSTWEFRLIGKKGFNISVTEAQIPERRRSKIPVQEEVEYSSPSTESSDEESQPSQGVTSGLYDPVLDDTEVIYETIGPADSDQQSNQLEQPTEVQFEVQQFTEQPEITRSLTSSPFLISTKPYRPFSTEPLEIPPIENPIILNPQYHDVFPGYEIEEQPPATKFKLPISEQYDPQSDPTKEIVLMTNKIYVVQSDDTEQSKQDFLSDQSTSEKLQVEGKEYYKKNIRENEQTEYEYLEKMKTEIDLDKIEATALNIVDERIKIENQIKSEINFYKIEETALNIVEESIQQAVTVAEDIKNEISIELKETVKEEFHTEKIQKETEHAEMKLDKVQKEESTTESKIESSVNEQTSDLQMQTLSVKEGKEAESLIKDLSETIDEVTDKIMQQEESVEMAVTECKYKHKEQTSGKEEKITHRKITENKAVNSINSIPNRAYTIGLQTIPNIRGSVQSSYHRDLLLKTFFVHLTDVMVALSRFVLTEPVSTVPIEDVNFVTKDKAKNNINSEEQSGCVQTLREQKVSKKCKDIKNEKTTAINAQKHTKTMSNNTSKNNKSAMVKDDQAMTSDKTNIIIENSNIDNSREYHIQEIESDHMTRQELKVEDGEIIRNRKLSGAKIAQIEGMKPVDLTDKMNKVISEFQRKSGSEVNTDEEYIEDSRRSRSISRLGDEVIHENILLENVSQVDSKKKSVDIFEAKSEKRLTESGAIKYEDCESENSISNENGKITYVAIVESHVYTNKDAIFEEQMRRMSESSKTASSFESTQHVRNISSKSRDVNMSVIKDVKDESLETLSLARNIESSVQKSSVKVQENSVSKVALQNATDIMEQHKIIHQDQLIAAKSHISIERPVQIVADKTETLTLENVEELEVSKPVTQSSKQVTAQKSSVKVQENSVSKVALQNTTDIMEQHKIIHQDQLIAAKSHISIERPVQIVADKTETLTVENIEELEVSKPVTQSSKQVIEASAKTVAQIKEVILNDENAVTIDTPVPELVKPKCALDTTLKALAEKTEVLVGDNVKNIETITSSKPTRQAKVIINESVATVVTEILSLEPKDVVVEVPEIPIKQPQIIIQEPVFHIPETVEMYVVESKGEIEVPKITTSKAKVQIEVAKVADQAMIITLEKADQQLDDKPFFVQKNANVAEEQPKLAQAEIQMVKVEEAKCEITDVTEIPKKYEEVDIQYTVELPKEDHVKLYQEESAELKIVKEEIIEVTPPVEVYEDFDFSVRKVGVDNQISQSIDIHEQSSQLEATKSSTIQSAAYEQSQTQSDKIMTKSEQHMQIKQATNMKQAIVQSQESKFTSSASSVSTVSQAALNQKDYQAQTHSVKDKLQKLDLKSAASSTSQSKSNEQRKLTLKTDLTETKLVKENGENDRSSPSTSVLPTPLVDEYVFKLEAPLPRCRSTTPVPRDCSVTPPSEHEDPNIVKKKLVPQIVDTNIEQVIFDPPLPTPTSPGKKSPPIYVKPGLRGGSDRPEVTKEEIMEIERKSSLLTSAIDETIRSIEEYKESVGIEMKEEIVEEQTKTESSAETVSEQNSEILVPNSYVEENEEELIGSEDEQNKLSIEEMHNDDTEQSVEQSVVFNGRITNGIKYDETTNGELNKTVETDFSEEKQEDVVETVTINLSKIKRDSLEDTNLTTTPEFNDNKENSTLNGDINIDGNNIDSIQSEQMNGQIEYSNITTDVIENVEEKVTDPLQGYRPVEFNPEAYKQRKQSEMQLSEQIMWETKKIEVYKTDSGEIIGSQQGIIDGLEEPVVDPEIAKELGKPGMPEEKIAELISGEAEMLREAHVMGLARVLKSHMHRTDDDSSVDFMKIKPSIESLKDSEVLKALNEEILRSREVKQKEERKWTTFLQKPAPKPKQKMVFCGNKEDALNYNFENLYLDDDTTDCGDEPYRVRIVKQPKPRIAPDFKPEDFDTGPLPWEQRAVIEEKEAVEAPPVEPEDPILIPEEVPEFVEAVDPLPESEVPDLEDTGIPIPPSPLPHEQQSLVLEEPQHQEEENIIEETEAEETLYQDAAENLEEMDNSKLSDQLMSNIESMVDPNATLEEQLAQMRAQLAALAQLPNVIQQTLELVTKQITQISHQKTVQTIERISESQEQFVDAVTNFEATQTEQTKEVNEIVQNQEIPEIQEEIISEEEAQFKREEAARLNREEEERMMEEQKRLEQQKKELIEQMRIEQESRQVKQRSTPRVGKPRPMFGPPVPAERPVVLPGGRKWRKPEDAYNEQRINEALTAQAEVIKGKAIGVNFMKYEKPPVSLDHLQQSEVYKVVHNMDQTPLKRVELLTPVVAEADYRERARSATPCNDRMGNEQHFSMPEQLQP